MVSIGFSFEYVLTNLLFVPFVSGCCLQRRHGHDDLRLLGAVRRGAPHDAGPGGDQFILEQDPANVPIVQRWIDKWTWRGYRVLTLVAMMMDYMLPKRTMSWKEAWEVLFEENGGALFKDLARYGIRMPKCAEQIALEKDHLSHQAWSTFYNYAAAANFHTWMPDEDEMAWLAAKYPNSFDKHYRPRYEFWREQAAKGNRFYNKTLPMLCQTCQIPMIFTEQGDATRSATGRSITRATIPLLLRPLQGDLRARAGEVRPGLAAGATRSTRATASPRAPTRRGGLRPARRGAEVPQLEHGRDNLDFDISEDKKNFAEWRGQARRTSRPRRLRAAPASAGRCSRSPGDKT